MSESTRTMRVATPRKKVGRYLIKSRTVQKSRSKKRCKRCVLIRYQLASTLLPKEAVLAWRLGPVVGVLGGFTSATTARASLPCAMFLFSWCHYFWAKLFAVYLEARQPISPSFSRYCLA